MNDTWRDHAACRDTDPNRWIWIPQYKRARDVARERELKAICAECPVRINCLDDELEQMRLGHRSMGIFGGTNASERVAMVNRASRIPIKHGTPYGYMKHRRQPDIFGPPCEDCLAAKRNYERERQERIRDGVADWVNRDHPLHVIEGGAA